MIIRGFTLLELMVVISLMVLVASAGISLVDVVDGQTRDKATLATVNRAREAVLGPQRSQPGYVATAYIQDLGILPTDTSLLRGSGSFPAWARDATWPVAFGWRGPYVGRDVAAILDGDASVVDGPLVDGWGRDLQPDSMALLSKAWELYAPALEPGSDRYPIIAFDEWQRDVSTFTFEITNTNAVDRSVRLRGLFPNWAAATSADPFGLGTPLPEHLSSAVTVAAGGTLNLAFGLVSGGPRHWPRGLRQVVAVDATSGVQLSEPIDVLVDPWLAPGPGTLALEVDR